MKSGDEPRETGPHDSAHLIERLRGQLSRLRSDPHALDVRVEVAALQARLGRRDEALTHYDAAIRGYAQQDDLAGAITLAEEVVAQYPRESQLKLLLAALYSRMPPKRARACSPISTAEFIRVTGEQAIDDLDFVPSESAIVVEVDAPTPVDPYTSGQNPDVYEAPTAAGLAGLGLEEIPTSVDPPHRRWEGPGDEEPTAVQPTAGEDADRPTVPYQQISRPPDLPILLTRKKNRLHDEPSDEPPRLLKQQKKRS